MEFTITIKMPHLNLRSDEQAVAKAITEKFRKGPITLPNGEQIWPSGYEFDIKTANAWDD